MVTGSFGLAPTEHVRRLLYLTAGVHVFFPEEPECNAMAEKFLMDLLIIRYDPYEFCSFFRKERLEKRLLVHPQEFRITLAGPLRRRKDRSDRVSRHAERAGNHPLGLAFRQMMQDLMFLGHLNVPLSMNSA